MLLDEPTQGMGHEDVELVTQLIKKVSANRTVLMVEHNMNVVSSIADTITVLARGSGHRRRALRRGVEESAGAARPTWAARPPNCRAPHGYGQRVPAPDRPARLVRRVAHPARRRPDGEPRRGGHAARPQRRRPHHHAEGHHGPGRPAHRLDHDQRHARRSACRRTASPTSASATAPRSAASSPACPARRTCCCRRRWRSGGMSAGRDLRDVPQPEGAPRQPGHAAVRRRAADAGGGAHPAHRRASCCCWTRSPKAWRR